MKWNEKTEGKNKTVNYEGGESYKMSPETELLQRVATCLVNEPKFYEESGETLQRIYELSEQVDGEFLLKLAHYTRSELYLRSVSQYLLTLASNKEDLKGKSPEGSDRSWVREYTPRIIQRADGIMETLACQLGEFGKPIPNSLKKGLKDTFPKFDEYQFAKYHRKSQEVTFKDAIMLTHPKEPSEIIDKLLDDDLKTPKTWETQISERGNKAEVWEELIDEEKLPYFASLRNLRNLLQADISDEHLKKVLTYIANPEVIEAVQVLPFRYYSAYLALKGVDKREKKHSLSTAGHITSHTTKKSSIDDPRISWVYDALEDASEKAFDNIPYMDGTTLIATDVSGSMNTSISQNSEVYRQDISMLLGSATHKFTDKSYIGIFGEDWKTLAMNRDNRGILEGTEQMRKRNGEVGHSTNGWKAIKWARENGKEVDRFLIFTDEEIWDSSWRASRSVREEFEKYRDDINSNAICYVIDLAGYGDIVFPENHQSSVMISGWSTSVFDFIQINEEDTQSQIEYIKEEY